MLAWIIQMTIVSLILIFIIHHLINFFKSTLTVPKIKDLVNNPNKKYDDIYNVISSQNTETPREQTNFNKNKFSYSEDELLPKNETDMKNELKSFLKKQLYSSNENHQKTSNYDTTDLSMLDSIKTQSYSSY
jgi:hypothetical protein